MTADYEEMRDRAEKAEAERDALREHNTRMLRNRYDMSNQELLARAERAEAERDALRAEVDAIAALVSDESAAGLYMKVEAVCDRAEALRAEVDRLKAEAIPEADRERTVSWIESAAESALADGHTRFAGSLAAEARRLLRLPEQP